VLIMWRVYVCLFSDLSFNEITAVSKRWLYGLNSLQRLYVVTNSFTYLLAFFLTSLAWWHNWYGVGVMIKS